MDNSQEWRSDSTVISNGPQDNKARVSDGTDKPPDIPKEYQQWMRLFQEETTAAALPIHRLWDHEVKLEPGKESTFGLIYALSEKELKVIVAPLLTPLVVVLG